MLQKLLCLCLLQLRMQWRGTFIMPQILYQEWDWALVCTLHPSGGLPGSGLELPGLLTYTVCR